MSRAPSVETWWPKLNNEHKTALLSNLREPLSADLVVAVAQAGGLSVAAYWPETQSGGNFDLSDSDWDWIDENGTDEETDAAIEAIADDFAETIADEFGDPFKK